MTRPYFAFELDHPRAWRTYLGGALLDELHGAKAGTGKDEHFPEEWIMSVVTARNGTQENGVQEGLSHLADASGTTLKEVLESDPGGYLGTSHAQALGADPGVLVKLIDSAERLTIQVHPDRETALRLFHSPFGKTECWHFLGGRTVSGQTPALYIGFREGVTRQQWEDLFARQDIEGMLGCLHRFEARPGETVLIKGGVPHAIGAGCFLAEIQEPTDYTIRVERTTPSGFAVDDQMCHQGIGFNRMFDCFHYDGVSREEARKRWFVPRRPLYKGQEGEVSVLVGYEDTPFFCMRELIVQETLVLEEKNFSGLYVLQGNGILTNDRNQLPLRKGGQYFVPAQMDKCFIQANSGQPMHILQCLGPCFP